jgi:VanZ family protein
MIKALLHNRRLMLVLAIAWTVLIFVGCSLPGRDLPPVHVFDHFDKVVHFTFFFVFSIAWLFVLDKSNCGSNIQLLVFIISLSFIYGFALEWYQINFVPGRAWDVWDGISDGVGGIAGTLAYKYLMPNYFNREH